jgi:predicted amidophosphoribosyltransferase
MMQVQPTKIQGRWREGFVLDYHTICSTYVEDDEYGHPQFETKRSDAGELLYRLKYKNDSAAAGDLVEAAAAFISKWNPGIDAIAAVPSSRPRPQQPVVLLALALGKRLGVPFLAESVRKARETPELKNVYDFSARLRLLAGVHVIDPDAVKNKVLLFDDLFRSGATMNAVAEALYQAGVADVFALAITRTRSNV